MAAITTTLLEFLRPGSVVLHSEPLYGGTDHFLEHILPRFGIRTVAFQAGSRLEEIESTLEESGQAEHLSMIFVETPANPTNALVDIGSCAEVARKCATSGKRPIVVVDNTFLGPVWQHPLRHGADLVLYSATKYIGGHSDVIAGVCLGSAEHIQRVRSLRTFLGSMAGPWTGWLLLRSLGVCRACLFQIV